MGLKNEFRKMIKKISCGLTIPPISGVFLPSFFKGGQPKNAQFMAMVLEGGAVGISYVLLPEDKENDYINLGLEDFIGKDPKQFAFEFGKNDAVKEMISIAAINAICQYVMTATQYQLESTVDSLGLLNISKGDRVGMVGLFSGLVDTIQEAGAELIVIEKNASLINKYPDLPITLDPGRLRCCNKVLCTSTTILNNSLDDIMGNCAAEAFVSVVGPTAGYFPDPLFARGVDVVGGRIVTDGDLFMSLISQGKNWGPATERVFFEKTTYTGY